MSADRLTVVIPTFNRPEGLLLAARSVFSQTLARSQRFSLVIVDNTPDASAAAAMETLRAECPHMVQLRAVHEPNPGVANARNAAMQAVETDLVAYLDDDQAAPANWLEQLLATYDAFPAAVVFGPVVTQLPSDIRCHRAYLSFFFGREPKHETGYITKHYGTGNALVDFSQVPGDEPFFDAAMNTSGGEDDVLFTRIKQGGGRFAWSADAPVFECPVRSRLSLNYALRRAFAYGRAPVMMARKASPPQYITVAKWMGVGGLKALWHGLRWVSLLIAGNKDHAFELDSAVRGIAKIFWFVDLHFYGTAALRTQDPQSLPVAVGPARQLSVRERIGGHG